MYTSKTTYSISCKVASDFAIAASAAASENETKPASHAPSRPSSVPTLSSRSLQQHEILLPPHTAARRAALKRLKLQPPMDCLGERRRGGGSGVKDAEVVFEERARMQPEHRQKF